MGKNELICDCHIIHEETVKDTLKKMPKENTFNNLLYHIS